VLLLEALLLEGGVVVFVLLPLGMIETRCVCRDPEIVVDQ
jgi:hypothetical protein